jgi:exonuclease SbcD
MKILCSSDWHLGKKLENKSRIEEQEKVLDNILEIVDRENPDVFIVAGDIYDTAVPTARAEELFYDFASKVGEKTLFVAIAGNHDDALRLSVASPLAKRHNILLFGDSYVSLNEQNLSANNDGFTLEKNGEKLCVAILPYPSERALGVMYGESYEEKVAQKIQEISERFEENATNMFVSHLFMSGAENAKSDERELGSAKLLSKEILPDCDFVLLGHVHKPMVISHKKNAHYSGSLLPYSFDDTTDKRLMMFDTNDKSLKDIPIKGYKKCIRVTADSYEKAMQNLNNTSDWIELHYTGDPLTMTQIADIRRHPSCAKVIIESKTVSLKENRKALSGKEMFEEFYKKQKKADAPERLVSLFSEYLAKAEGEIQ